MQFPQRNRLGWRWGEPTSTLWAELAPDEEEEDCVCFTLRTNAEQKIEIVANPSTDEVHVFVDGDEVWSS